MSKSFLREWPKAVAAVQLRLIHSPSTRKATLNDFLT
jgi:hypothetical protein